MTTAALRPPVVRRRRRPDERRQRRAALLFISPWIVGFVVFTAGPMIASLWLSFTDYDAINAPEYVGTANYRQAISGPRVRTALWNTFVFPILYVPASIVVALALALMLTRVRRGAGVFRTVFYLPSVTPPVAAGIIFLDDGSVVDQAGDRADRAVGPRHDGGDLLRRPAQRAPGRHFDA
jgi:multiple sugar transport system permease protein